MTVFRKCRLFPQPVSSAHHHSDLPAAATGADQPLAPIENGGLAAEPSSHLGGVGLDLVAVFPAQHDQSDSGSASVHCRDRRVGWSHSCDGPNYRQNRILTIGNGTVYRTPGQAGPGNDIKAGSRGF
jgi:hypothetical protein